MVDSPSSRRPEASTGVSFSAVRRECFACGDRRRLVRAVCAAYAANAICPASGSLPPGRHSGSELRRASVDTCRLDRAPVRSWRQARSSCRAADSEIAHSMRITESGSSPEQWVSTMFEIRPGTCSWSSRRPSWVVPWVVTREPDRFGLPGAGLRPLIRRSSVSQWTMSCRIAATADSTLAPTAILARRSLRAPEALDVTPGNARAWRAMSSSRSAERRCSGGRRLPRSRRDAVCV